MAFFLNNQVNLASLAFNQVQGESLSNELALCKEVLPCTATSPGGFPGAASPGCQRAGQAACQRTAVIRAFL